MSFSDKQLRALGRQVPPRFIKSRMSGDKELSYIEGWYAIAEANRIFGHDGWDRETVEVKCLQAREARGTWSAVYSARVRIKVRAAGEDVVRDGHGTGEAFGPSLGEVHDRALKVAETDATKRALATFGKPFGLALYAGLRPARALEPEERLARDGKMNGEAEVDPPGDHDEGGRRNPLIQPPSMGAGHRSTLPGRTASRRVRSRFQSRCAFETRSICALSLPSPACCVDRRRRTPTTSASLSRAP